MAGTLWPGPLFSKHTKVSPVLTEGPGGSRVRVSCALLGFEGLNLSWAGRGGRGGSQGFHGWLGASAGLLLSLHFSTSSQPELLRSQPQAPRHHGNNPYLLSLAAYFFSKGPCSLFIRFIYCVPSPSCVPQLCASHTSVPIPIPILAPSCCLYKGPTPVPVKTKDTGQKPGAAWVRPPGKEGKAGLWRSTEQDVAWSGSPRSGAGGGTL